MQELLTELVLTGRLDAFTGDETQLPRLLMGIDLLRKGAMAAGNRQLAGVKHWGIPEMDLLRDTVPFWHAINAAAEDYHGSFGKPFPFGPLAFVWGTILGPYAGLVFTFYEQAPHFCTRVVGIRYNNREAHLRTLKPGDPVVLLWEPQNPQDPFAVRVFSSQGLDLGYIRSTIAHALVSRLQNGSAFMAKVSAILGPEFDANERLNLEVKTSKGNETPESQFRMNDEEFFGQSSWRVFDGKFDGSPYPA